MPHPYPATFAESGSRTRWLRIMAAGILSPTSSASGRVSEENHAQILAGLAQNARQVRGGDPGAASRVENSAGLSGLNGRTLDLQDLDSGPRLVLARWSRSVLPSPCPPPGIAQRPVLLGRCLASVSGFKSSRPFPAL